jgi:hypothetical protein
MSAVGFREKPVFVGSLSLVEGAKSYLKVFLPAKRLRWKMNLRHRGQNFPGGQSW